jgi:cholesterol transport system auxiliary component
MSLCLFDGCVRLEKGHPDKHFFLIHLSRPGEVSAPLTDDVLKVLTFSASPPYEGKGFLYAKGDNRIESDFYNEFLISPSTMFTEEVRKWMAGSGLFGHVTDLPPYQDPAYFLEGRITALYGDYRDPFVPKAVLGMEFLLLRDVSASKDILLENDYKRELPLDRGSPAALVNGWRQALRSILLDFEGHVRDCLQGL